MARKYAKAGNTIEFTAKGAGNHDVYFNGIPAELKKLSSHNNIVNEAKDAVRKQGAKIVLFEFTKLSEKHYKEINKLSQKYNIHGKYINPGGTIKNF